MDFLKLQNLVKQDPVSYRDEFVTQWKHFLISLDVVKSSNSVPEPDSFSRSLLFLAQCTPLYVATIAEVKEFPNIVVDLLQSSADYLPRSSRLACAQALFWYVKKARVNEQSILESYFRCLFALFAIEDKELRTFLFETTVSFTRSASWNVENVPFGIALQTCISKYCNELNDKKTSSILIASHVIAIMIKLFVKGSWKTPKVANMIINIGLQFDNVKMYALVSAFLAGEKSTLLEADNDESGQEDAVKSKDVKIQMKISGYSKSLQRRIDRLSKKESKGDSDAKPKSSRLEISYCAIQMIGNPYGVSERLFKCLKQGSLNGEHVPYKSKLLLICAVSRIIGVHKILLADFYTLLRRYIQPHQKDVLRILAFSAQSIHDELPKEWVEELIKTIAHAFIAEHCADEVVASGINSVKEICSRCDAITSELLNEIAEYQGSKKDKIVKVAARGLVNLYRELAPNKLGKAFRGREASMRARSVAIESDGSGESEDELASTTPFIDPSSLHSIKKRKDYDSRMKSVLAGREGREKFGSKKRHHLGKMVGKTNKQKAKLKPAVFRKRIKRVMKVKGK